MLRNTRVGAAVAVALSVGLLTAPAVEATNGYFSHGYGTKNKGMAGAGVAFPQDALAAATNPAGMAFVGHRVDLGVAAFSPRREYTVTGMPSGMPNTFPLEPGTVESDSDWFVIPHFGWNRPLGERSSFGISVYGNGGMNTDYPAHANPVRGQPGSPCEGQLGTFCAGGAGVDLMQLFVAPTYARRFGESGAWGISPILAAQRFKATGLGSFVPFSSDPANLTDRGYDMSYGAGAKVGVQAGILPGLVFGASYQSKIYMSDFDRYRGLFAEEGGFDIPATGTVGLAWEAAPATTVVFDVQRIWYGDVRAIANPLLPNLMTAPLGADDGAGFGWRNMTVYKLGLQWEAGHAWTWRAGVSYGRQPIPDSEVLFNILAPGVMETHVTAGFTREVGRTSELNFAAMYAPRNTVRGINPLEVPGQQEIELEMRQFEVELSWAWRF
jgi:long-chain fatty acid transport protein